MISSLSIRNYQSLHEVDLDLAGLTVIEGPSSSGKSALTRAIKTLTSNTRGNAFITHGERVCTITATTDNGTVSLKRGKGTSDNEYTLLPNSGSPEHFTKLGGETPPEVSEFIGIQSRDPINYAGQFDKPYLLDDSAAEVARTLGALTNVNVIFEAARESNRRKLASTQELRRAHEDLANIRNKIPAYAALKAQQTAITTAEQQLLHIKNIDEQLGKLTMLSLRVKAAEQTAAEQQQTATQLDLTPVTELHTRITKLLSTLRAIQAAERQQNAAADDVTAAKEITAELQSTYTDTLVAMNKCPTCKQSTKGLQHDHD